MEQPTCKACTKCGATKPLSDFYKGHGKHGHKSRCKPCQATDFAAWSSKGPKRKKQLRPPGSRPPGKYSPAYYLATREVRLVRKAAYRAYLKARDQQELAADRARLRPNGLKTCSKCRTELPLTWFHLKMHAADGLTDRCRSCTKAKTAARLIGPDTLAWWAENGMDPETCTYCGADVNYLGRKPSADVLHVDHIFPQSRGGTDDPKNLAPACAYCNTSKGARLLADWLTAAA